jgi:hypothetical protein
MHLDMKGSMNAISECVRRVVVLLVSHDWEGLERLTSGQRLSAEEIERAVSEYPATLSMPPDEALESLDVVEVAGAVPRELSIWVPLWTLEEGRSDLHVELTLKEVMEEIYNVELDNLRVP